MTRSAFVLGSLVALLGASVAPAAAQDVKTPVSASTIMTIVTAPVDVRKNAYDAGLKDPALPSRADEGAGEVLADGSVRYGRAVITVRNPCPPGEHFDLPAPKPGRR